MAREGARVVVADLNMAVAEETAAFLCSRGHDVSAISGNAIDESDVSKIVAFAVARYGQLDTIVNMAGKVHWSSVLDMDVGQWTEAVLSFPTAGMLTTKHAAKAMIAAGRPGSIIHLLSTAAHFGEAEGAAYCASKAALLNFARSAAMDLAHNGIRVNTVTPCAMEHQLWTKMQKEVTEGKFVARSGRPLYSRDDYLKMIPLERFPRASDIAWATIFLASDESGFMTGADLPVDGGLRHKYPISRPGDQTGVNIGEYVKNIQKTEYGEERARLFDGSHGGP
jgi:NAD(P)-dependent dehydrogenase (short-subunit alcohol dehydrogenase family)